MKYLYTHPFTKRVNNARRRARKYKAIGDFTRFTIENLYVKQEGKCNICCLVFYGVFEIDHIIPLSKGGTNERANIQLLCPKCNKIKGNKINGS